MIRNLFFDLDDTLWDTRGNNTRSLEQLFISEGWAQHWGSFSDWIQRYWLINDELWQRYRMGEIDKFTLVFERLARPLAPKVLLSREELLALNERFLQAVKEQTGLIAGAKALLQELSSRYRIILVTNGFTELQHEKVTRSGLAPYISQMIISEEVGAHKPHAAFFHQALANSHSRKHETLLIGDSWQADIEGALAYGIPAVWFNPEGDALPSVSHQHFLGDIRQLSQLPELLASL